MRVPVHARSDPDGPRVGQSGAVRREHGRRGALERARAHGRRHGPAALCRPHVLHHEQQGQDGAHTRRQDAHRAQDVPDRDPAQQRRARTQYALRTSPSLLPTILLVKIYDCCFLGKVLLGGGQEAMSVTTTSLRQGKFEARFWHRVFEEEVGRVKGHFGPLNTYVIPILISLPCNDGLRVSSDQNRGSPGGHRICVRRGGRLRSGAPL